MMVRRVLLVGCLIGVTLAALIPPRLAIGAGLLMYHLHQVRSGLAGDDQRAVQGARRALGDYEWLRADLVYAAWFVSWLGWVPAWGADLTAAPQLVSLVDRIVYAAAPTLDLADALIRESERASPGADVLRVAHNEAGRIAMARERVAQARAVLEELDSTSASTERKNLLRKLERALVEWESFLALLQVAPQLLGADRPRSYLILAQNSDELRATGGFISAVGVVNVNKGEISVGWFGDSYSVDNLELRHKPAPLPLEKYMWAPQWLVRDSNWSPDFPTSAREAASMVANDRGWEVDGVIAVDLRFVPLIVAALPDTQFAGEQLTPDTVLELLKASWKPLPPGDMSPAWFDNDRKNFISELFGVLLAQVEAEDVSPARLAAALLQGLREKSVQIYLEHPAAQAAVRMANWGGTVEPGDGDYVFVVDSNVGFNKVNARVKRETTLTVDLASELPLARVELTYTNPSRSTGERCDLHRQNKDGSYASLEESCYWNYVRVLAPRGARLVSAEGVSDGGEIEELDTVKVFAGYMIVERGTSHTAHFDYVLPANVVRDGVYRLFIQRQAGAPPAPMHIRVRLPRGMRVRTASQPPSGTANGWAAFDLMLDRDIQLEVTLAQDQGVPPWELFVGGAFVVAGGALLILFRKEKDTE